MRLKKTVEIDDQKYVVRELTIRQIIDLFNDLKEPDESSPNTQLGDLGFLKNEADKLLNLAFEGEKYSFDDFIEFAPSEVKELYDAFKEVNSVFFHIAREVGLEQLLTELKTVIKRDFSELLAGLSKQDTLPSSNMGTLSL
jgi:hypothetical protein